jgi:hypothetical protein
MKNRNQAPVKKKVFKSGPFKGVSVRDTFARAALQETPVTVNLGPVSWPASLAPKAQAFGTFAPGKVITVAASVPTDVLVILYTELEISAFLDVFTGSSAWTPATKKGWCLYGHNFAKFKGMIQEGVSGDPALEAGAFGYLAALTVGNVNVTLYKTELHPKTDGPDIPFIAVIGQLISELNPKLVISTGTAGAIGSVLKCGDVVVTNSARLHCMDSYPLYPDLNTMSRANTEMQSSALVNPTYVQYAAANFTKLSLPGMAKCYAEFKGRSGYSFLTKNSQAPSIYVRGVNAVPGPEPMDVVSADYLTVDDNNDSEGLEALGVMNETDDAFAFFAISQLPSASQPQWLSVRNASEPQVSAPAFPAGTSPTAIVDTLKGIAGPIYGVYQYCTTLNSAFACWGVIAGMS